MRTAVVYLVVVLLASAAGAALMDSGLTAIETREAATAAAYNNAMGNN